MRDMEPLERLFLALCALYLLVAIIVADTWTL
jgi:hypothetical protein